MNVLLIISSIWAAVTVVVALRLYLIAMHILANFEVKDLTSSRLQFAMNALTDASRWPFYIVWYGLKSFLNDLKK